MASFLQRVEVHYPSQRLQQAWCSSAHRGLGNQRMRHDGWGAELIHTRLSCTWVSHPSLSQMTWSIQEVGRLGTCTVWHWHTPTWLWCFWRFPCNVWPSTEGNEYLLRILRTDERTYLFVILTLTPEIALTKVDFPWATWPIVPMLMVAWREMMSGVRGVSFVMSAPCSC